MELANAAAERFGLPFTFFIGKIVLADEYPPKASLVSSGKKRGRAFVFDLNSECLCVRNAGFCVGITANSAYNARQSRLDDLAVSALFVMIRNHLTLRSKKHQIVQRWLFALIFLTAVLAVCWLLVGF